nr:WGR domain-containing protein [uncultured Kingella sp.]
MEQCLRYTDLKSDKFWRIETQGSQFVVNYGKYGTNGRYEIKEFDSPEACEKQAQKLAAAKQKKGYAPADLPAGHLYFDDEEYGHNPLTSHPIFRQYFADEDIYYNECDEETAFGSDDGADTLCSLQEAFRKARPVLQDFIRHVIECEWGFPNLPPQANQSDVELKAQAEQETDGLEGAHYLLAHDRATLATMLGAIKISGRVDSRANITAAIAAAERIDRIAQLLQWADAPSITLAQIRQDLTRFAEETSLE